MVPGRNDQSNIPASAPPPMPCHKLRILAFLGGFDRVPELFPVGEFLRCAFGQQHLGMNDPVLVGEIMIAVEPVVVQGTIPLTEPR